MKNNTVCTAGDVNYLWGLFLLIASMRKSGMDEPVLAGVKHFTPEARRVLEQFGDVRFLNLDSVNRSLTCLKGEIMLAAENDFLTWCDSDALFTGNCSARLPPLEKGFAHARLRSAAEMPGAFRGYDLREILPQWQRDVAALAKAKPVETMTPEKFRSCPGCYLSVGIESRHYLEVWDRLKKKVLPDRDRGVVDFSLRCYHQLDESCMNACFVYLEDAPTVAEEFRLDKVPAEYYAHFIGAPKPWRGWNRRAVAHFDTVVSIVEWAEREKLLLPGPVPYSLRREHKLFCELAAGPVEFWTKARRKLGL